MREIYTCSPKASGEDLLRQIMILEQQGYKDAKMCINVSIMTKVIEENGGRKYNVSHQPDGTQKKRASFNMEEGRITIEYLVKNSNQVVISEIRRNGRLTYRLPEETYFMVTIV